jgi:hypothetical protein
LPGDPLSLSMDVGVDSHDFRPWHFDEIQAIMKLKADARACGNLVLQDRKQVSEDDAGTR